MMFALRHLLFVSHEAEVALRTNWRRARHYDWVLKTVISERDSVQGAYEWVYRVFQCVAPYRVVVQLWVLFTRHDVSPVRRCGFQQVCIISSWVV